jgi:hypothetical protein
MFFRWKNKQDLNRMIEEGRAYHYIESFYALSTSGTRTTHDRVLYCESKGAVFFKSSTIFSMKNKERKKFIYLFIYLFCNGLFIYQWYHCTRLTCSMTGYFFKKINLFCFLIQINFLYCFTLFM